MIEVHHLNNSRSQRVLWMLEELGVPYTVVRYERDAITHAVRTCSNVCRPRLRMNARIYCR